MIFRATRCFVSLTLIAVFGCAPTPKPATTAAPTDSLPPEEPTVWQLPAEMTGTLRPDRAESFTVTDGQILVSLTVPPASVETEQSLTVRLVEETTGRFLEFEPPLRISKPASVMIVQREAASALLPVARSAGQYQPVRYETQGTTTSAWVRSADGLWMGEAAAAQAIAAGIVVPTGVDCGTVAGLDDLGDIMGLAKMQEAVGADAVPDTYAAIAHMAAVELNRILSEDIPAEPCRYYLASLLELGRILGTIGIVDVTVDVGSYQARVQEVLNRCTLEYLLTWDGQGRFPDGRMVFWTREPNRGVLGTTHQTPHVIDGRIIGAEGTIALVIDADLRLETKFDMTDPFFVRAVLTTAAVNGQISLRPVPDGETIVLDFDQEGGAFGFSMSLPTGEPFVAGAGSVGGGQLHGVVGVAGLGLLDVHTLTDAETSESYTFDLRAESMIIIEKTDEQGVVTIVGTLLIPALQDVDFLTKQLCLAAVSPP